MSVVLKNKCSSNLVGLMIMSYSKNPYKRTCVLGVQADFVLIYRVFSAKSA